MSITRGRAPTVALERLPALDGLRGVAALMVVLTHAAFLTGVSGQRRLDGHLLGRGDFGVSIFFALSGFLLYRLMVHERSSTGKVRIVAYAARRFARVVPAYWVTLAALVVVTAPGPRDVLLHAATGQIYVPDSAITAFGQSWSVATELSFYLVLPLLTLWMVRLRSRRSSAPMVVMCSLFAVTSALGLLVAPAWLGEDIILERTLPWRAPHFLVGMIIAEAVITPDLRLSRWLRTLADQPGGCLSLAGAAYLAATTPLAGSLLLEPAHGIHLALRTFFASVVAAGLLLPLALGHGSVWSALLSHPGTRWLGTVSYGVFLWHLPVLEGIISVSGAPLFRGGLLPLLAVGLPISLLLGFLSHRLIELPASRLAARLTRHGSHHHGSNEKQSNRPLEPHRSG